MKNILFILLSITVLSFSFCTKSDIAQIKKSNQIKDTLPQINIFKNPIIGNWEIGPFKIISCGTDTTVYSNTKGDYVDFKTNDTAYYTFNSTNAKGWSPYNIIDDSTFILGDTIHIILFDSTSLTTYCKTTNGGTEEWATYFKK